MGTEFILGYYLHSSPVTVFPEHYLVWESEGLKFLTFRQFQFGGNLDLRNDLDEARTGFSWRGPIWVMAGGFHPDISNPALHSQPFQQAVGIFEVTPQ
jgi:hypothetical protein